MGRRGGPTRTRIATPTSTADVERGVAHVGKARTGTTSTSEPIRLVIRIAVTFLALAGRFLLRAARRLGAVHLFRTLSVFMGCGEIPNRSVDKEIGFAASLPSPCLSLQHSLYANPACECAQ